MTDLNKIPPEIEILFERAKEFKQELTREYEKCIGENENISLRALSLTHDIFEKIRHVLDHTMSLFWKKRISIRLSQKDKKKARVYFPIAKDLNGFKAMLGRAYMQDLDSIDKPMYDLLLSCQPFEQKYNKWLNRLAKLAGKGKHEQLINQKKVYSCLFTAKSDMGNISWVPKSLKLNPNTDPNLDIEKLLDESTDPFHQNLISNPYVTIRYRPIMDILLEEGNKSALSFCSEVIDQAYRIVKKMVQLI